jgi:Flp pilus assembly protein protease CpaA
MNSALLAILILLLAVVVAQDFKDRAISWFLIPLLFIGFIAYGLLQIHPLELLTYFGINFMLVAVNLLCVTLFISMKEKRITNILKNYLGLGDVLFFLVLTVVFSPFNFIFFYLGSIFLTTLVYGVLQLISKEKQRLIPLAGVMSLLLLVTIVAEQLIPSFQFYQDLILNS